MPEDAAATTVAALEENVIADDIRIAALEVGGMRLFLGPAAEEIRQSLTPDRGFPMTGYGARAVVVMGQGDRG